MKGTKLKILILEDSPQDFELIIEQLSDSGYILELAQTDNEKGLISHLETRKFDIILSDFKLVGIDAFGVLEICKKYCPNTPFICMSGSIGEETAIELLKKGAVDYVLKDRPERLPFAIQRAIEEVIEKEAHHKAVRALAESEHRFKQVAEDAKEWIWEVNKDGKFTYASPVVATLLGYSPDELVDKKYFFDFFVPAKSKLYKKTAFKVFAKKSTFNNFENHNIHKDGHHVILSTSGSPILNETGELLGYRGVDTDITEQKMAELALLQSEEKFRKIFMNHSAVKFIIEPQTGNIIEANDAAAGFYGWSVDELQNMKIQQIYVLPENNFNHEIDTIEKKDKTHFETKHKKADGTIVDVEVFSSSINFGGQHYQHYIIHDISERKKAEKQVSLLNKAIESSTLAVTITNFNGEIIYANPFFIKNSGYTLEEIIGKNPRFLKSGNQSRAFYTNLWNTILSGKDWEGEIQNKKKNGELFWVKAYISPIVNNEGEISNFVAIEEDITERKKILEELQGALFKAKESDRLKSAFLMNMSHEIRTPMNGILGFMNLLDQPDLGNKEKSEFIRIINKSGERLMSTINDIIEISKIEIGDLNLNNDVVNLEDMLDFYFDFFHLQAQEKGIKLQVSNKLRGNEAVIQTDKHKLDSIFMNLVKNAIKFTQKGRIEIGSYLENNKLCIYVTDTGKGIPKDKLDVIFDRFIQVETGISSINEGSGLGLTIVKAFVEALNGTIDVSSVSEEGSTFLVKIPYNRYVLENEIKNETPDNKFPDNKFKILIAEDDEINYLYLEHILSAEFELIHAYTGDEAVELFTQNHDILLVLMDIKLPGKYNGLEATRRIRKFNTKVPIIAQTAYALGSDRQTALEAGCNDYISKPFKNTQILSLIREYCFSFKS